MIATLAIHCGGVGDLILTLPALEHLARSGPLDLAGYPERLELAVAGGIARRAWRLDDLEFHSVFDTPSERLREFLLQYQRLAVWMKDDNGQLRQNLEALSRAQVQLFAPLPPADWSGHAMDYFCACVDCDRPAQPTLKLPVAAPSCDVVIHPGSGSARKNWPLEHFAALANALTRGGRHVSWIRGPAEEAFPLPRSSHEILEDSLTRVGGVLQRTRLFVGNDSGITHLAAAVGCPTVAIFGPTDPDRWGPQGERVHVLRGAPWPSVDTVLETASGIVGR